MQFESILVTHFRICLFLNVIILFLFILSETFEEHKAWLYGRTCSHEYLLRNGHNKKNLGSTFEVFTHILKVGIVQHTFWQNNAQTSTRFKQIDTTINEENFCKTAKFTNTKLIQKRFTYMIVYLL